MIDVGIGIVDLDFAKVLKAEGFNVPTEFFYRDKDLPCLPKGLGRTKNGKKMNHNRFDDFIYSAPTVKQTIAWRIKKLKEKNETSKER